MGHNRAGDRVRARGRRRRKENKRLALKYAENPSQEASAPAASGSKLAALAGKVKHLAHDTAETVGGLVKTVKEKITGHHE